MRKYSWSGGTTAYSLLISPILFGEISRVDFQKNGQKSMKNGRFGSGFLHVSDKMVPLRDPTFDYYNFTVQCYELVG